MKKIYFLIGSLSTGGAERVVSNISDLLYKKGYDVSIILFGKQENLRYETSCKILLLDNIEPRNLLTKTYVLITRVLKVKQLAKQKSTIISFLEYPNVINVLANKKDEAIISVRNHMSTKHQKGLKSYFWKLTFKFIYPRAKKIIAVSQEISYDLCQNYGIKKSKISVVYNSYPIEKIEKLSREKLNAEELVVFSKKIIITSGRLSKQKDQNAIINSYKCLKRDLGEDIDLVIMGCGKEESNLKLLAEKLDIKDNVHFLGFRENPFKYLANSSLFIMTSLHEGFPNALVEAMICGLPVISTDCPSGPREILLQNASNQKKELTYGVNGDDYGVLIPLIDQFKMDKQKYYEYVSDLMKKILTDDSINKNLSNKAKMRSNMFDINNMILVWEKLIMEE
jgi:glycosyltransferase involved in cell wall biosynthesis